MRGQEESCDGGNSDFTPGADFPRFRNGNPKFPCGCQCLNGVASIAIAAARRRFRAFYVIFRTKDLFVYSVRLNE